jgi:hypothetical protein
LAGVFVSATGPSGAAPTPLNFSSSGTSFTSLSPELDQAFFIGDGLTGDDIGTLQEFIAPAGATFLYLGVSDACGYNGGPSCYGDNAASFDVTYSGNTTSTAVPEPFTLSLFGAGFAGAAALRRRKRIQKA